MNGYIEWLKKPIQKIKEYPYKIITKKKATIGVNEVYWGNTFDGKYECPSEIFEVIEKKHPQMYLPWMLGRRLREEGGEVVFTDLREKHCLIAGMTRSGKTTFLNGGLLSLLHYSHPQYLKVAILDPKRAQFKQWSKLVTLAEGYEKGVELIDQIYEEVKRREEKTSQDGWPEDAKEANELAYRTRKKKYLMPYILFIFDEVSAFARLCREAGNDDSMARLNYLVETATSLGVHCILTTQAPYAKVIDGQTKNNFTERMTFRLGDSQHEKMIVGTKEGSEIRATRLKRGVFIRSSIEEEENRVLYKTIFVDKISLKNAIKNWQQRGVNFKL
jgi:hypothetical protein